MTVTIVQGARVIVFDHPDKSSWWEITGTPAENYIREDHDINRWYLVQFRIRAGKLYFGLRNVQSHVDFAEWVHESNVRLIG